MSDTLSKLEQADKLARSILNLSKNTLIVNLRFLDSALGRLDYVPIKEGTVATDGQHLFYNMKYILESYKNEKETVIRDYLHVVFHCIFRHLFINEMIDKPRWDLAADIAVENSLNELGLKSANSSRQTQQAEILSKIKEELNVITAEKLYRHFLEKGLSKEELVSLRSLFYADSHEGWYPPPKTDNDGSKGKDGGNGADSGNSDGNSPPEDDSENETEGNGSEDPSGDGDESEGKGSSFSMTNEELEEIWKDISEKIQVDLETVSKSWGDKAGALSHGIDEVNRERYDYASFLKRFALLGEAIQINDEEFDYIFYTYGFKIYENMPLVEPLEYKELKRIREFVIAIDTSASVSGELVQRFVQKTYNILKQTENFFTKINLHIIQCDVVIQEDAKITSQEEFDEYIKHMTLKGFGGTDFRTVFKYVDELILEKEFLNLKGLIYFTDGYGDFPSQKPAYDAAFVFLRDDCESPEVPVWAIKLVLDEDDI